MLRPPPAYLSPPPSLLPQSAVVLAFERFRRNHVDLSATDVADARSSNAFLLKRITALPFGALIRGDVVPSGSLARGTKIQPLNDVDVLLPVWGGNTMIVNRKGDSYDLIVTGITPLSQHADFGVINSIKLLNDLRKQVRTVPQYRRSGIRRNLQVVNVDLQSRMWSFDVAPAVEINMGASSATAFAIPDGYGRWLLTDPRRDAVRVDVADAQHHGLMKPLIRTLKAWNERIHKPVLPSYYFETLVLDAIGVVPNRNMPEYVAGFFAGAESYLMRPCPDPKNLAGPLDADLSVGDKYRYRFALRKAAVVSARAVDLDRRGYSTAAIGAWKSIFGDEFGS